MGARKKGMSQSAAITLSIFRPSSLNTDKKRVLNTKLQLRIAPSSFFQLWDCQWDSESYETMLKF